MIKEAEQGAGARDQDTEVEEKDGYGGPESRTLARKHASMRIEYEMEC